MRGFRRKQWTAHETAQQIKEPGDEAAHNKVWASKRDKIMNTHTHTHTQLSPMLVNTMKAHTCSLIRNAAQKRHSNHAQISRTSHTQVEMSHTQYEPLTHKSKCRTQKKVELSSWGVRQISMLIY
jgi:hypothetical protein